MSPKIRTLVARPSSLEIFRIHQVRMMDKPSNSQRDGFRYTLLANAAPMAQSVESRAEFGPHSRDSEQSSSHRRASIPGSSASPIAMKTALPLVLEGYERLALPRPPSPPGFPPHGSSPVTRLLKDTARDALARPARAFTPDLASAVDVECIDLTDVVYADHHAGGKLKAFPEHVSASRSKFSKIIIDEVHHVACKSRLIASAAALGVGRAAFALAMSEERDGSWGRTIESKMHDEFVPRTLHLVVST